MRWLPILMLLGGCWPYLPGDWTEYAATDTDTDTDTSGTDLPPRLFAYMFWLEYSGGFDADPFGTILMSYFDDRDELDIVDVLTQGEGEPEGPLTCVDFFSDPGTYSIEQLAQPWGDDDAWLARGAGEFRAYWWADDAVWEAPVDEREFERPDVIDLVELPIGDQDMVALDLLRVDPRVSFTPNVMAAGGGSFLSADELEFTWPDSATFEYAHLTVRVTNSANASLQLVSCVAPKELGAVWIPAERFTSSALSNGEYFIVYLAAVDVRHVPLEGSDGEAIGMMADFQVGAFAID